MTSNAAKRPSATGSWRRRWCSMKVMKHTRQICVREKAVDKRAVETGGGKEGVSWKNVENDGERTISAWDVGTFLLLKIEGEEISAAG